MRSLMTALLIVLFAAPAMAAQKYTACVKEKKFKTKITVNLTLPEPTYNFAMTRDELNTNKHKDHEVWLKRTGMQSVWQADEMETLGEAAGGWGVFSPMAFTAEPYDRYGTSYCPYFKSVEINMVYLTKISVPKNFKQGGCMFTAIMAHEWKHHVTNATVAHEITERLKKDMPLIVAEVESTSSFVDRNKVEARFKFMEQALNDVVAAYMMQSMQQEMQRRNDLIDTPEEYKNAGIQMQKCGGK